MKKVSFYFSILMLLPFNLLAQDSFSLGDSFISLKEQASNLPGEAAEQLRTLSAKAGLNFEPIPASGCSGSAVEPDKVEELLDSISSPSREYLATLLNSTSALWAAQLYLGEDGSGICFPAQNKLVRIEQLGIESHEPNSSISQKISTTVGDLKNAVLGWSQEISKK